MGRSGNESEHDSLPFCLWDGFSIAYLAGDVKGNEKIGKNDGNITA
jgi:hypothetical protein